MVPPKCAGKERLEREACRSTQLFPSREAEGELRIQKTGPTELSGQGPGRECGVPRGSQVGKALSQPGRHGHRRRQLLSDHSLALVSARPFLALECASENQDLPRRVGLTEHCVEARWAVQGDSRGIPGGLQLPRFRGRAEAPRKSGVGELVSEPSFYKQPLNRDSERGSGWPGMHSKLVAEERGDPRGSGGL